MKLRFTQAIENYELRIAELQQKHDEKNDGVIVSNKSRTILHDEKYIYINLHPNTKKGAVKANLEYANYTEELFCFLANPSLCSYKTNNKDRTQIELMKSPDRYSPLLHRFLYAYYTLNIPVLSLANDARNILKQLECDIDHVNSNIFIHCKWNLAGIPEYIHNQKYDLAGRIKPPYYCLPFVMEDGSYRIEYGYIGLIGWKKYLICNDAIELNQFLRNFFELKPFIEMGERFKAPRMLWANNKKEICFSDSFEVCVRAYENIMKLDESKFQYWQP